MNYKYFYYLLFIFIISCEHHESKIVFKEENNKVQKIKDLKKNEEVKKITNNYSTKLKILNNHPDLGNKAKITSLTIDSLKEQTNAGLDQCTKEEFDEFNKLNHAYKKFGFPFILAVKGKNKIEILNNFKKRINSEPNIEFNEAVKQVKKIASLRLEDLKNKNI